MWAKDSFKDEIITACSRNGVNYNWLAKTEHQRVKDGCKLNDETLAGVFCSYIERMVSLLLSKLFKAQKDAAIASTGMRPDIMEKLLADQNLGDQGGIIETIEAKVAAVDTAIKTWTMFDQM